MNAPDPSNGVVYLRVGIADDHGNVLGVVELNGLVQAVGEFERLHGQGLRGASPNDSHARAALARVFRPR